MEAVIRIDGGIALRLHPESRDWGHGGGIVVEAEAGKLSCRLEPDSRPEAFLPWLEHLAPENGHRERFKARARKRMRMAGLDPGSLNIGHELWGNADLEYTGKVVVEARTASGAPARHNAGPASYQKVDDETVGLLVGMAGRQADQGKQVIETRPEPRQQGLSGARGKISLRWDGKGRSWLAPQGSALSTHILKNESGREWLPAEARVEACCQRALALAGVGACDTWARGYAGIGTVVSRRSDRVWQEGEEEVRRVHQEEWSQAIGLYPEDKKMDGPPETEWPGLLAMLGRHAREPQEEQRKLAKVIAAVVLMGNGDAHRRNVGVQHVWGREGESIVLAPVYDFSTTEGATLGAWGRMEIPVGGKTGFDEVQEREWVELSREGGTAPELVLEAVREVAERLPDALEQAKRIGRETDAAMDSRQWEGRTETIKKSVGERCARTLRELGTRTEHSRKRALEKAARTQARPMPRTPRNLRVRGER